MPGHHAPCISCVVSHIQCVVHIKWEYLKQKFENGEKGTRERREDRGQEDRGQRREERKTWFEFVFGVRDTNLRSND
jgi:hypothetical protein